MKKRFYLIVCLLILLFVGCSRTENTGDKETEKQEYNKTTISTLTPVPTSTSTPVPTATATMIPSPTKKPTKMVKKLVAQTSHSYSRESKTEYVYDNKGKVIGETETDSKGRVIRDTDKEYDEQGRLSTVTVKNDSGTTTATYTYDGLSAIVKTEKAAVDGSTSVDRAFEEYDERGNLLFRRNSEKEETFNYDAENRLIEEVYVQLQTPMTKRRSVYEYEDKSDYYTRVSIYENDDKSARYVTEYAYSLEGNHREATMFLNSEVSGVIHYDYDEEGDCIRIKIGSIGVEGNIDWNTEYTNQYDYVEVDDD